VPKVSYRDSGVDIDEADRALKRIKRYAQATFNRNVLAGIGAFGAAYRLEGWKDPVLISSADGVGTKLKVAFAMRRYDTVGEDLVNHCVNDIMVQGATPLFFLDYFAAGRLEAAVTAEVVRGIARGCRGNQCALIGGETAEMPGFYAAGEFDVAGFIVGAAERRALLTGSKIRAGDALIGLPSTGLHTNGYSLARKLFFDAAGMTPETKLSDLGCTVGEELLKVHRSYKKPLDALRQAGLLKGAAHITGGGITDNTPRMLPAGLGAEIHTGSWPVPPVFAVLRSIGSVPEQDWRRTFNLGIGLVAAVSSRRATEAERILSSLREPCYTIGRVVKLARTGAPRVLYLKS